MSIDYHIANSNILVETQFYFSTTFFFKLF